MPAYLTLWYYTFGNHRTPSLIALPTGRHDALVVEETLAFGNITLSTDGC